MDPRPMRFLVPDDLPIQFVSQQVDGRIEVGVASLAVDILSRQADRDLGDLVELLHAKHDVDLVDMIKVPPGPAELLVHVAADGVGDIDVMPFDGHMHGPASCFRVFYVG